MSVIKAMYEDATTTVRVNELERKQGLQCQSGSASGLSLQSIAVYHCVRGFREGLPMELLYADDLVLVAET